MPTPFPSTAPPPPTDDAHISLTALRYLQTSAGRRLIHEIGSRPPEARLIEQWRRAHPRDAVHAAVTLAGLQAKATAPRGKFPGIPLLWAVPEALEQASSLLISRHKATRFAALMATGKIQPTILDLCAGIGGDTLGLAAASQVIALESSEVRAFCIQSNAAEMKLTDKIQALRADVRNIPVDTHHHPFAFHIDPSRRAGQKRLHQFADLIPGPDILATFVHTFPAGAIKLSPGVDIESLPPGHLELISERGTAVQAILWTGLFEKTLGQKGERTATVLSDSQPPFSITALPGMVAALEDPKHFIYEVDAAVHRAELAGRLAQKCALSPINLDGGYLSSDTHVPHAALTPFEHIATVPFSEKRVAAVLTDFPIARERPIEIKTRGGLGLDTDTLQRALTKIAPCGLTVLIYRGRDGPAASIARRLVS